MKAFFNPKSIAIIGASSKPNSVGEKIFKNISQNDFKGKIYAINPKHTQIDHHHCYPSIKNISDQIDLAIIVTPATCVPIILQECAEKEIKACVIISSGFSEIGSHGKELEQKIITIAEENSLRFIGPNCLGIMRPSIGLNATFDNNNPLPGHIALVSQSGALSAGILDWAVGRGVGFSAVASIGNAANVTFSDILHYLANDSKTHSILLYIEGIRNAKEFMKSLKEAAQKKPVIVIKAGKYAQGVRAALSHTGALIGNDLVFDAALNRCGAIRVATIEDLFSAAEILSSNIKVSGNKLLVVTNGGGAGVMAADFATQHHIDLPSLKPSTIEQLNQFLPSHWSHQNPIDLIGDANPTRYHETLRTIKDENVDAILVTLVPVAMAHPLKVAQQVIEDQKTIQTPILTCWIGEHQVKSSWQLFSRHKIPVFETPEKAIRALSYLINFHQNQTLLLENHDISHLPSPVNGKVAKEIIKTISNSGHTVLTQQESKEILKNFCIPVNETDLATTCDEAILFSEKLGFPVAMKISSSDISHKQDMGGVVLNIANADSVRHAFEMIMSNAHRARPNAIIQGITVEKMISRQPGRELMIGIIQDAVFGPVISFGAGGTLVEILKDFSLELPPLNQEIAYQLIQKTQVSKLLMPFRNLPGAHMQSIIDILLRVSEMCQTLPEILEMDINPLIVDEHGAIVVDARIVISKPKE